TGGLCAIGATFTQTLGCFVLCGFAMFLLWEGRRERKPWKTLWAEQACLLLGFVVTLVAANFYLVWKVGFYRFFQCTLVYLFRFAPALTSYNSWRVIYVHLMGGPWLKSISLW